MSLCGADAGEKAIAFVPPDALREGLMKTDTLFYSLFQEFPSIFFELIGRPFEDANAYQFSSVELKQTALRIDGLFLPVPDSPKRPIYFVEVQFQKDPKLYSRLFSEIFLYLHQSAPTKDWCAVVVYPRRSLEPTEIVPYRTLLASEQVQRVYLDELGEAADESLGIGIVQLVVERKARTINKARRLLEQARQGIEDENSRQKFRIKAKHPLAPLLQKGGWGVGINRDNPVVQVYPIES